MGMGEEQGAGYGDEDGKNQPGTAGSDAACLHAPFENGETDNHENEDSMQQHLGICKRNPETVGAERPDLRIASQEKKKSQAKKNERPVLRPRKARHLRENSECSDRENNDARPVMVVLGPSLFRVSALGASWLRSE